MKALGKGMLGLGLAVGLGFGALAEAVEPLIVVLPADRKREPRRVAPPAEPRTEVLSSVTPVPRDVPAAPQPRAAEPAPQPQAESNPTMPVPAALESAAPVLARIARPTELAADVRPVQPSVQPREQTRRFPSIDGDLHFRTVVRRDELRWNIAGGGVNILSELTWDDLRATGGELSGRLALPLGFVALADAGYGHIHDGDNQDSDYFGNNRTLEFSRSNNGADDGLLLDTRLALGYEIAHGPLDLRWLPMVGLAYHSQELNIDRGVQTLPSSGPFQGLDSHYDTSWFGPWAGLKLSLQPHERLRVKTGFELHAARYEAVANWNLRSDFAHPKSFEHSAQGLGTVLSGELSWRMTRRWTLDLSARWMHFATDPGRDTLYFADGTTQSTRLNEVVWESLQLAAGVTLRF